MATLAANLADTSIDDYEAIAGVIQLYVDGSAKGDRSKLERAFHADARMYGALAGHRYDVPIEELFKMAAEGPMDTDGRYRARITSVDQVGDVAVATLLEEGCWGSVSFVDYFSLIRLDRSWTIVNKVFTHTGGTPPF
ncbi:MAG TPA: nuclear transport factor 2 family protein [Candidatus Dormibacteraeota bacterium]|nr:nuclear transport factor 2 family protein [Candidatus Dormibacteraeota bacterium]